MKNKKILSLVLMAGMILSLTACGEEKSEVNENRTTVTETSVEAETSVTASTEAVVEDDTKTEETTAEESTITVTDLVGREVTITPGSYERVVCIGAGALRMYSYVGDVNLLSGVEDIDNTSLEERPQMFDSVARPYVIAYEDVFQTLPSCGVGGPNAQEAEAEKILACEPDIVISEYEDADKENALQEQLGVPVITLSSGSQAVFDERFFESLRLLGTIFEKTDRAEELISYVQAEKEEISSRTQAVAEEDKKSVYMCGLGNWGTTSHLMTSKNFVSLTVANVKNVVTDLESQGVGEIEEEKFVSLGEDMDIMIIDAAAIKNIKPLYAEDPTMFDTCKAWQDGEVYLEMAYNAYYTNYELNLCNTWYIAKVVYPDLFEDIDITAKTNEITKMFLGQELAEEIFTYPASFGGYQQIDTKTFLN